MKRLLFLIFLFSAFFPFEFAEAKSLGSVRRLLNQKEKLLEKRFDDGSGAGALRAKKKLIGVVARERRKAKGNKRLRQFLDRRFVVEVKIAAKMVRLRRQYKFLGVWSWGSSAVLDLEDHNKVNDQLSGVIVSGGANVPVEAVQRFEELFGVFTFTPTITFRIRILKNNKHRFVGKIQNPPLSPNPISGKRFR